MPVTIKEYRVKGAGSDVDGNGLKMIRPYIVEGLNPTTDPLLSSLYAVDSSTGFRIPQYGQFHPQAANITVMGVHADPYMNSTTSAVVTVTWGSPQRSNASGDSTLTKISIRGSVQNSRTRFDYAGKPMILYYQPPRIPDPSVTGGGGADIYPKIQSDKFIAPWLEANAIVTFERNVFTNSGMIAIQSPGCTNSDTLWGFPVRTWVVREHDVDFYYANASQSTRFHEVISLQYKPLNEAVGQFGWDVAGVFTDLTTHKEPSDIDWTKSRFGSQIMGRGNPTGGGANTPPGSSPAASPGWGLFRNQKEIQFAALNLPNPFQF